MIMEAPDEGKKIEKGKRRRQAQPEPRQLFTHWSRVSPDREPHNDSHEFPLMPLELPPMEGISAGVAGGTKSESDTAFEYDVAVISVM